MAPMTAASARPPAIPPVAVVRELARAAASGTVRLDPGAAAHLLG